MLQTTSCSSNKNNIKKSSEPVSEEFTKRDTTKKRTTTSPNYGKDQQKIDSLKKSGKKGE